jgi:uncharacterized caspase-like protein
MRTLLTRRALLGCAAGAAAMRLGPAFAASGVAKGDRPRVALVIGNGAYPAAPLRNPPGDADAVATTLRGLGYDVTLRQNTRLRDLVEALRDFSVRAPSASVRMLFYAGHGVQVKGRNFLVPIDADPKSEEDVRRQTADVGEFIDRLSAIPNGTNIVVLDACRVNPFAGGVIVGPDGRRLKFRGATPGGLAPLDAPVGTLVAFSTAPNGVALDGAGTDHSVYARHLLANLPTPGLPIEQLFKRVRIGVAGDTGRVQVPWESSSLTADFCFKSGVDGRCG